MKLLFRTIMLVPTLLTFSLYCPTWLEKNITEIKQRLADRANLDEPLHDVQGDSPLVFLITNARFILNDKPEELFEKLLENGANPDGISNVPPLCHAVVHRKPDYLAKLLRYRAEPNKRNFHGDNPLDLAVFYYSDTYPNNNEQHFREIIESLLRFGANPVAKHPTKKESPIEFLCKAEKLKFAHDVNNARYRFVAYYTHQLAKLLRSKSLLARDASKIASKIASYMYDYSPLEPQEVNKLRNYFTKNETDGYY